MNLPNNMEDNALTTHLLSPNETSSSRNGLHLSGLLAKETPQTPPNNPGYGQSYEFFSTHCW